MPNSDPDVAVNAAPHVDEAPAVLCARVHSLLPFTFQMVIPFLSPVTVHPKLKVLPGQVGGAAVNCADASPAGEHQRLYKTYVLLLQLKVLGLYKQVRECHSWRSKPQLTVSSKHFY